MALVILALTPESLLHYLESKQPTWPQQVQHGKMHCADLAEPHPPGKMHWWVVLHLEPRHFVDVVVVVVGQGS